jgi:hypothetical protein
MSSPSTGPRSPEGKERSSLNALKHGLRSQRPVLPGEDAAEWDAFRAAILRDLGPGTTLEEELAERVALQLWRLRRAARYEAEVAADDCEAARHAAGADPCHRLRPDLPAEQALNDAFVRLRDLKDDLVNAEAVRRLTQELAALPDGAAVSPALAARLLTLLSGVTWGALSAPAGAGELRAELAELLGLPEPEALAVAARRAEDASRRLAEVIADWAGRIAFLRQQLKQQAGAREHDSRLLQTAALERVVRYEAHVSRQLNQSLLLLRQFKDERRAREVLDCPAVAARVPIPTPVSAGRETPAPAPPETPTRSSFGNPDRAVIPTAPGEPPKGSERVPGEVTVGRDFVRQSAFAQRNGPSGNRHKAARNGRQPPHSQHLALLGERGEGAHFGASPCR